MAVITPLLAAAIPVISGSRITVNQAINTYGLSAQPTMLDRAFSQTRRVPRLLVLMLTNTFRRKGRVILTQITLVLSGLIFMMVMSARDSVTFTFSEVMFSILDFNVNFLLEESESINHIEELTLDHPDVKAVEMWGLNSGSIRRQGEPATDDDEGVVFFGVPLPTELYDPQMRGGRWLLPEETYAVVLNHKLAQDAGVGIGDWVTVDHGPSGEADWLVVGLLFDVTNPNAAYASRDVLLREIGSAGKASSVWIQTVREDPASEVAAAKSIRVFYEERGIDVNPAGIFNADTSSETKAQALNNFGVIITLLLGHGDFDWFCREHRLKRCLVLECVGAASRDRRDAGRRRFRPVGRLVVCWRRSDPGSPQLAHRPPSKHSGRADNGAGYWSSRRYRTRVQIHTGRCTAMAGYHYHFIDCRQLVASSKRRSY